MRCAQAMSPKGFLPSIRPPIPGHDGGVDEPDQVLELEGGAKR